MSFEWRLGSRRSMAVGGSAGAKVKQCGQDRGGGVPVSHQLPTHHHLSLRPGSQLPTPWVGPSLFLLLLREFLPDVGASVQMPPFRHLWFSAPSTLPGTAGRRHAAGLPRPGR